MPNLSKTALAHELLRKVGAAHLRMREMAIIIQRALRAGCDSNERHAHRRIAGGHGEAVAAARTAAYDAVSRIHFPGMQFRTDIAAHV